MALTFPTNPTPGTTSNGGLSGGFQSWTWDGIAWKLAATPFVATSSTITSDMITNGTIVDADVSGTAAIALSKIQPVTATNGGLVPNAAQIHVQNSSNAAVSATVGGDLTATVSGTAINFAIATGVIVNNDISSTAGIVSSKFTPVGYQFSGASVSITSPSTAQFVYSTANNLVLSGASSGGATISQAGFYLISLRVGANGDVNAGLGATCQIQIPGHTFRCKMTSGTEEFVYTIAMQLAATETVAAYATNATGGTLVFSSAMEIRLICL